METKNQFYSDLDHVMANANSLTMVIGELNLTLGESMYGVAVLRDNVTGEVGILLP